MVVLVLLLIPSVVFSIDTNSLTLGQIGLNVTKSFNSLGKLIIATAYITGIGFGIAAIFKFKQVKDNPTQIPISTPFALLGVSAMLVFLPGIFTPTGKSIFGDAEVSDKSNVGGFTGVNIPGLPGSSG